MKVGDIVRARDGVTGVVLDIKITGTAAGPKQYWVTCLWSHDCVAGIGRSDVEVISESR